MVISYQKVNHFDKKKKQYKRIIANDKLKRLYSFFIYYSIYIFQIQNNNANNHILLSKNKFNKKIKLNII